MGKIGFVIDSTVYLDEKTIKENNIEVVPLNVLEEDNVYPETEITQDFVFEHLDKGKKLTTSQPSPEKFKNAYEKMIDEGYEKIVAVVISKGLSGTYQSAILGRDMLDNPELVHVFDTKNAGFGNELIAMKVLEFLKKDPTVDQLIEQVDYVIENCGLMFTVENLYSLWRGGRLSRAQAFLGTVLRIRPVIRIQDDGTLKLEHKERTQKKLLHYIVKQIKEDVGSRKNIEVRMTHQRSKESVEELKELLESVFDNIKITITGYIGPVFSIHIGKKGFGIAWYAEN